MRINWQPRTLKMKVRLILIAITTMLVLATVAGLVMFDRFRTLALGTSEAVIHTIETSYGFSQQVNRLVALASEIGTIDSFQTLAEHRTEAVDLIDRIGSMARSLDSQGTRSTSFRDLLVDGLEPALLDAEETQFRNLVLQQALSSRLQALDQVLDRLTIAVDRIAARGDTALIAELSSTTPAPERLDEAVRRLRVDTQILAQVQTLVVASKTLAGLGIDGDLVGASDTVSRRLSTLAAFLGTRPDDSDRRDIAVLAMELREQLWGTAGLIPLLERAQATTRRLDESQRTLQALARESADLLQRSMVREQAALVAANARAETLSRQIQFNDLVLRLLMTVGVLAITATYFGREVTSRVLRLAETVRELAAGRTDITIRPRGTDEIAEMERAIIVFRDNARALRRSNAELQEFAYVASHDLRSPLRAIQDLADWTIEDFSDELPPEAQRNLDLIRARSDRLSRLLSDLFAYAKVDSGSETLSDLDLVTLATELDDLLGRGGSFAVQAGGITRISTVATPVRTILMNLVSNAIKHHDRLMGQVTITGMVEGDSFVIEVADDGPGIDKAYQDKIFELFQTLKPRDDMEGSGFGLAYVRKLVLRLNGTITVQSDPSVARGSVFRFSLPLNLMHESPDALQGQSLAGKVPDAAAA